MKKSLTHTSTALATTIALLASLLAPLPLSWAGDSAAFDPSTVLSSPALQAGEEQLAFDMNRVISQQTNLIRYQATEYQRRVAEERARAYVAAQRRTTSAPTKTAEPKSAPKKTPKSKTTKADPKPEEPKTVAAPKKLPRYIAVDTVKDKRASPKAKKVVMIWDTQAQELVGNNLYDVENPVAVGTIAKFETYAAEYIGAGR